MPEVIVRRAGETLDPLCEILLDGLKPKRPPVKKGKKRKVSQEKKRSDYSAYFFRQHRRVGGIELVTS